MNFFGIFYDDDDDDDDFDDGFDNFNDNYSQNERTESAYCGCPACKDRGWNTNANGFTCGERIKWVQGQQKSMIAACSLVGGTEFPDVCGTCNPGICSNQGKNEQQALSVSANGSHDPCAATFPLMPQTPLYCFPPYGQRKRWEGVWEKYIVEVKEGGSCGPGNNIFSRNTVSLSRDREDLSLEYKMTNGQWEASEVRILLPQEEMPYKYGTYQFFLKDFVVERNGAIVSHSVPDNLVLGLFTWDSTENYELHCNYNHEVDIEISRWNNPNNADGQFLIQPPEKPRMHRFSTGSDSVVVNRDASRVRRDTSDPRRHNYEFTWNPGVVTWRTDAGGGHRHVVSTNGAVQGNFPDRVQCLPANVEVRINLWNMMGKDTNPTGMQPGDIARAVIGKFKYIPSGLTAVEVGGACTKDCQCGEMANCIQNRCSRF